MNDVKAYENKHQFLSIIWSWLRALHFYLFFTGKICLIQIPNSWEWHVSTDHAITLKILTTLDRFLDTSFWSRNIWVIEEGLASWTTQFLQEICAEKTACIKHVMLKFSYRDLGIPSINLRSSEDTQEIKTWHEDNRFELYNNWYAKYSALIDLQLDSLLLDFTEAVSSDGIPMDSIMIELWPPFIHDLPAKFKVLAVTPALAQKIEARFRRKYSSGVSVITARCVV